MICPQFSLSYPEIIAQNFLSHNQKYLIPLASPSSAMASLLLAAAPPLSSSFPTPSIRLSFSQSESLASPFFTPLPSLSAAASSVPSPVPSVYCGRGDRKTKRGKRFNHSFGNARPRDKKKGRGPPRLFAPPAPSKKDRFEDNEIVKIEIDESLFSG